MRVLQVVTLVSPDGAYGGPVRVALNQLSALNSAGHVVALAASQRGYPVATRDIDGVPTELFPARVTVPYSGFAGLSAPAMLWWFVRNRRSFDVVHVHLARDLVTLPLAMLALRLKVPLVVQTHGMIDASSKRLARVLDAAVTRRVLRGAESVLYLTNRERSDLLGITDDIALSHLPNGVPLSVRIASPGSPRPELLFLARLHPRKRVTAFVRAAIGLLDDGVDATFAIAGPDEGDGAAVRALIDRSDYGDRIRWDGPIPPGAALDRMLTSAVYVLPAVDEPFPMAVLEAMSVGLPVVVTESCGLAELIAASGSGAVIEATDAALRGAMADLVADPGKRVAQGRRGREVVAAQLDMGAVRQQLENLYEKAQQAGVAR